MEYAKLTTIELQLIKIIIFGIENSFFELFVFYTGLGVFTLIKHAEDVQYFFMYNFEAKYFN